MEAFSYSLIWLVGKKNFLATCSISHETANRGEFEGWFCLVNLVCRQHIKFSTKTEHFGTYWFQITVFYEHNLWIKINFVSCSPRLHCVFCLGAFTGTFFYMEFQSNFGFLCIHPFSLKWACTNKRNRTSVPLASRVGSALKATVLCPLHNM